MIMGMEFQARVLPQLGLLDGMTLLVVFCQPFGSLLLPPDMGGSLFLYLSSDF